GPSSGGKAAGPTTPTAEGRKAQADFHRALAEPEPAAGKPKRGERHAALPAYFVGKVGRWVLPAIEAGGGGLAPNLKSGDA
ncbi:MAG: hypothetical protein RSG56_10475, partial [Brevundimonas sp.]